jgi:dsDNA-binding SOS-regulon protein
MKKTIKYIYYREVQGSSDRSFKTIQEVHKYAKMMNIENYEVKEVIKITR